MELGYPCHADVMRARLTLLSGAQTHFVALAEGDGRLLGWIHAEHRTSLESGDTAEIVGLVVSEGVRRSGVGQALIEAVEDWARSRALGTLVVRSNVVRPESHAFYQDVGFAQTKTQHVHAKALGESRAP
jgi:GNAT superfamily N-acetyltransferase